MPHSIDRAYAERAIPQYERAVALAGGEPVRIPLDQSTAVVQQFIESCDGVLLPGSNADIDPAKFRQDRSAQTAKSDERREQVDELLLEHAYARRKPVLGICYGLQSLNVFHGGSLIQHIPGFLPEAARAKVNHEAGRDVAIAHTVEIAEDSRLVAILEDSREHSPALPVARRRERYARNREGHGLSRADDASQKDGASAPEGNGLVLPVNSSHHQSADSIGDSLRVVARCPDDGIIEAIESSSPDHFVLAVQWHPERSVDDDVASRKIFQALIEAAGRRQ
jgi:putative glutamine amidotransferase